MVNYQLPKYYNTSHQKPSTEQTTAPSTNKHQHSFTSEMYLHICMVTRCQRFACLPSANISRNLLETELSQNTKRVSINYQFSK